jgi:hypothetical protein
MTNSNQEMFKEVPKKLNSDFTITCGEHLWGRKQTPFVISMCILRDLPQFYMFPCSHQNMFFSKKWERSEEFFLKRVKRELFTQGEVPVLVCSPEVWEHPWAHALKFPSRRNLRYYNITCT